MDLSQLELEESDFYWEGDEYDCRMHVQVVSVDGDVEEIYFFQLHVMRRGDIWQWRPEFGNYGTTQDWRGDFDHYLRACRAAREWACRTHSVRVAFTRVDDDGAE